ncbi:hypothetical protein [Pseudomonas viridiflava]|uniref:hypothetical protein n=1 Tax=Pseudomonas viridiflava TaxID=33069 RepID=UPI000F04F19C|nr:hypothetical protein [Pseudomonas viridiflava]
MFFTDSLDEVGSTESVLSQPHRKIWRRFDTYETVFQIFQKCVRNGAVDTRATFVSDPYELEFLTTASTRLIDSEAPLVLISTPGHVNGTEDWSHDTLLILYLAAHKVRDDFRIIYVTDSGVFGMNPGEDLAMYLREILYIAPEQAIDLFDQDICRLRNGS